MPWLLLPTSGVMTPRRSPGGSPLLLLWLLSGVCVAGVERTGDDRTRAEVGDWTSALLADVGREAANAKSF